MKRAAARSAWWVTCFVAGCALVLGACAAPADRDAVDLAGEWLRTVERAHTRADAAIAAGDAPGARTLVQAALEIAVPARVEAEHRRAVQQDLWFRLASIDSVARPEQALLEADRGLALGRADDIFSANLLAARGHALAALGRDAEAAASYHAALEIDERLLHAALGEGQPEEP